MSSTFNLRKRIRNASARPTTVLTLALIVACVAAVPVALTRATHGADQDIAKLNQFVQTSNSPAVKIFREGRDLIEVEQWAKAEQKFNGFVSAYPKDRDVDAALYWLAYALEKQEKFREASQRLERLVREFPRSSWADEARAMLVQIAPQLGERRVIEDALNSGRENEEIKIVALQSLFQASPERAVAYVADILKPDSKASRSLKEAAVSLLGSQGGERAIPILLDIARNQPDAKLRQIAIHRLGDEGGDAAFDELAKLYDVERDFEIKKQILHAFAEMESARAKAKLLEVARGVGGNTDTELRKAAIHWLGDKEDGSILDELMKIYDAERGTEIRGQIIHALSEADDARATTLLLRIARTGDDAEVRKQAIRRLGEKDSEAVVDELTKIYESDRDPEIRQQVVRSFAEMENARALAKLLEVARGGDNLELRKFAIRRAGEKDDAQIMETLVRMYDAESSYDIKETLLRAFGESNQKSAVRKLMDVARNDSSVELRKQAVRRLGESKDPEAAKFLEKILN